MEENHLRLPLLVRVYLAPAFAAFCLSVSILSELYFGGHLSLSGAAKFLAQVYRDLSDAIASLFNSLGLQLPDPAYSLANGIMLYPSLYYGKRTIEIVGAGVQSRYADEPCRMARVDLATVPSEFSRWGLKPPKGRRGFYANIVEVCHKKRIFDKSLWELSEILQRKEASFDRHQDLLWIFILLAWGFSCAIDPASANTFVLAIGRFRWAIELPGVIFIHLLVLMVALVANAYCWFVSDYNYEQDCVVGAKFAFRSMAQFIGGYLIILSVYLGGGARFIHQ